MVEYVTSPDGTRIAFTRSGSGAPLVLVHGTGRDSGRWASVLPSLESRFTVLAMDRCGRGASGDRAPYAVEREYEDIKALIDAIGEPAHLLGHSFGALCTLEAALLSPNLRRLVLYEPAMKVPSAPPAPEGVIDRLQELVDAGDFAGVLTTFYRELVMMSSQEVEQLKTSPSWPARVASAHTVVRESRVEEDYLFDAQRFRNLQTPTLLLLGADSPAFLKEATQAVAAALPNSRIAVLPGQGHFAMDTAPDLFVQEVLAFLTGSD